MSPKGNYTEPDKGNNEHIDNGMEMEKQSYINQSYITSDGEDKNHNIKREIDSNTKDDNSMDFDDLLPHIGEFGFYQKLLFLLMIPFAFFVAWVYFTQIFITINPEQYWCKVPELANLTVEER